MNLKNRTAKAWQRLIERNIPEKDWPKVCSVIWWDFTDRRNSKLTASEWWLKQMYSYDWTSQYTNLELGNLLAAVGYKKLLGKYENGTNQNDREKKQKDAKMRGGE